jgi:hypothetical protein
MSFVNTGILLPADQRELLRDAARGVQRSRGGRVSVSRLLSELVDHHADDLQAIAAGETNLVEVFKAQRAGNS